MKRLVLAATVLCILSSMTIGRKPAANVVLPDLHVIKSAVLSPSYSCRSTEEFKKGYQDTGLFLLGASQDKQNPDLLFNGACGSTDYFEASTAGDDMSLIADLGADVALEDLSASRAFNLQNVHSFSEYTKFARAVKVNVNHSYAVLLNSQNKRGLFVFTVTEYVPNKQVSLKYAVQSYQLLRATQAERSPGFDWQKRNGN